MTIFNGTSGDDSLTGSGGNDSLSGLAGNDAIFGEAGNDTLLGGAGNDTLYGSKGDDTARYTGNIRDYDVTWNIASGYFTITDSVAGRDGVDIAYLEYLQFKDVTVHWTQYQGFNMNGTDGNDTMSGTSLGEIMNGLGGHDSMAGNAGFDSMTGGEGNDTMLGLAGNDTLEGYLGNDRLFGGEGDDYFEPGAGDDSVDGGPGIDAVSYIWSPSGVSINLVTGVVTGGMGNDTLVGIEHAGGAEFDDRIVGTADANELSGAQGNDTITAGDGADTVYAGSGDDSLSGGSGNDLVEGGEGNDTLSYEDATAGVVADIFIGTVSGGGGTDTLTGIEHLTGSAFGDTFSDNEHDNVLEGRGGNDTLYGSKGDDTLLGGSGDDWLEDTSGASLLDAGDGNDTLIGGTRQEGGLGNDRMEIGQQPGKMSAGAGDDTLVGGAGADTIDGGSGNDVIDPGNGSDSVMAGSGDDRMTVRAGLDTLDGGEGIDTAVVNATSVFLEPTFSAGAVDEYSIHYIDKVTLRGIERVAYQNATAALDLGGHAGDAVRMVGAALGGFGLEAPGILLMALSFFDAGMTTPEVADLAADAVYGGASDTAFVSAIFRNVTGAEAAQAHIDVFSGWLASGAFTRGSLLALAASPDVIDPAVDMTGLQAAGMVWCPT